MTEPPAALKRVLHCQRWVTNYRSCYGLTPGRMSLFCLTCWPTGPVAVASLGAGLGAGTEDVLHCQT